MSYDAYQFQVFIGPKLTYPDSAYHFDWNLARTIYPPALVRTLSGTLAAPPTASSVPLSSTSSYPSKGGVWVKSTPAAGTRYEYIEYGGLSGNSLVNLFREEGWSHAAGSTVAPFMELEGDNGTITVNETIDDTLALSSWSAQIAGYRAPESLLRPGHICLVQRRKWDTASKSWGSGWSWLLVGVVQNPRIQDDAKRAANWNFTIVPVLDYRKNTKIKGVRVGNFDVGPNSSAQSSTPLAVAYKEAQNNDFDAAEPGFDASNLLTDEVDKLWINNKFLGGSNPSLNGTQEWPHVHSVTGFNNTQYAGYLMTQLYINLPAGNPKGAAWMELTCYVSQLTNLRLVAQNGQEMITGRSVQDIPYGGKVIICDNLERFEAENPGHGAHDVLTAEGRESGINIFNILSPSIGGLAIFSRGTGIQGSIALWGGQSYAAMKATRTDLTWSRVFSGATAAAPALTGQTLRYLFNPPAPTQGNDYWTVDYVHTPGYDLPGNSGIGSSGDPPPWVQIELPGLGLELASNILANATTIPIKDASGPSTNGLPTSGTIQIGTEQINYSAKGEESLTCSPTAQPHVAGDKIYLLEGGTITDALPIKQIQFLPARSGIRPELIRVSLSRLPGGARRPNEGDGYVYDYQLITDITYSALTGGVYNVPVANRRIKTALFIVRSLNSNEPKRPRLQQIKLLVDRDQYDQTYWASDPDASLFLRDVLSRVGYAAGSIITSGSFPDLESQQTATTSAYDILLDTARQYLLRVSVGWDSRITITPTAFWTTLTHAPAVYWYRHTLQNASIQKRGGNRVKQMEIEYSTAGASATYYYPTVANRDGTQTPAGPYRVSSAGLMSAIAINLYNIETADYVFSADVAGTGSTVKPGDIHAVTWDWGDQEDKQRKFVIVAVEHKITKMHWFTKIGQALQIERGNPN